MIASTGHTDDLRPPKIRSTREAFGGHWQRLDFDTPAITWSTCWPQPAHVALPHLRQITCRHIGRSSSRVDRTKKRHYTPRGVTGVSLRQVRRNRRAGAWVGDSPLLQPKTIAHGRGHSGRFRWTCENPLRPVDAVFVCFEEELLVGYSTSPRASPGKTSVESTEVDSTVLKLP